MWWREGEAFRGGVEYDEVDVHAVAPPADYPCQLISCNAMKNHPGMEDAEARLVGRPRLIHAYRNEECDSGGWGFRPA